MLLLYTPINKEVVIKIIIVAKGFNPILFLMNLLDELIYMNIKIKQIS